MARRLPRIRTLVLIAAGGLVAAVAILVALRLTADGPASADLGTRTIKAGDVEVNVTAVSLAPAGARFRINLDTHAGSLDLDLAQSARLRVDGREAPPGVWSGAGPGGHHREGTLTFATPVNSGAVVNLTIAGLSNPAAAAWTAP